MPGEGPLTGLRVVELASAHAAFAGKLLGDLGAEVVLVEPRGGHPSRGYAPFAGDEPGLERSLFWWHYNTSKLGVVLDLEDPAARRRFVRLIGTADIVLEGEPPGRLAALGIDHDTVLAAHPRVVWVSVTPFGRDNPRAHEQATDLTVLAGGGPAWSCGYDDHLLPPVRGGGNQGYQTGSMFAALGALTAVLARDVTGRGQHVDVSMHAAANVTTEGGSYWWLVCNQTVQRQTMRHANVTPTRASFAISSDGKYIHSGFPPRTAAEFTAILGWIDELRLRDEFPEVVFLEIGIERGGVQLAEVGVDVEATEAYGAGRDGLVLIASRLTAREFFAGAQARGLACGPVNSPEETLEDEHFVARGFPVTVSHDDGDVVYPGAPFISTVSPWRISRRAPHLGEHDDLVLGPLGP
jgi:crotonobetainyl-CoA:carnitine CoA-transferase CaiB-like acyl-CoA transferase